MESTPATCAEILVRTPDAPTGTYEVDPDGPGGEAPFSVRCEMDKAGGGWTLVALEKEGVTQTLRFLGAEQGTPNDLIDDESAIIGVRFQGHYSEVRIEWDTDEFIQLSLGAAEFFANIVNTSLPITEFSTSSGELEGWIDAGGGAKLCRAAASPEVRPGDTSWAIKPLNDNNNDCGCNNMAWAGRGAFYAGTASQCTACSCWDGGFAGVQDNGEKKANVPGYDTRIYIR